MPVLPWSRWSVSACATADVGPINTHVAEAGRPSPEFVPDPSDDGSTVIGVAFSGGGTRAAAFGYGVLRGLDEVVVDRHPKRRTAVDDIRMISGTSGGAVPAAYFGLQGQRLCRPARTLPAPGRRERASPFETLAGQPDPRLRWRRQRPLDLRGLAERKRLRRHDLQRVAPPGAPIVWINASDIYNGTPFDFTYDTFAALCSDLDKVRLADAVAASAAFPVVFKPLVVSTAATAHEMQLPAAGMADPGARRPRGVGAPEGLRPVARNLSERP